MIEIIPEGGVTSPRNFFAGAIASGIKKRPKDALDLSILYSPQTCETAGVFTTNKVKAAAVILDQNRLRTSGKIRAVVINSGCANACTGELGMANAVTTTELTAKSLGIRPEEVLVASTGVIGEQLPMDKIQEGIGQIALSAEGGYDLTQAIMTTDTRPKATAVRIKTGGSEFIIGGTAKGAGMIHPNMATMLSFITTDARVNADFLNQALKKAVDISFNMISVDGDTSTNDTVLVMANGAAGTEEINGNSRLSEAFQQGLEQVCLYLAKSIARDGEGASRLIEAVVNGAVSLPDARLAARAIASSPLVKTAIHGCDPNWGRILAAAGRSGAELVQEKADVYIGDLCLLKAGTPQPFEKKSAAAIIDCDEIQLRVELHLGEFNATAWGCDLSEEYVVINSEYTT